MSFLSSQRYFPQIDVKAEEILVWTQEALDRMEKAPPLVRGIAKTAVHRFAIERGHSVITESVIDMAMEAIMPQRASEKLTRVAKEIAEQKVLESDAIQTYICGEWATLRITNNPSSVLFVVHHRNVFRWWTKLLWRTWP